MKFLPENVRYRFGKGFEHGAMMIGFIFGFAGTCVAFSMFVVLLLPWIWAFGHWYLNQMANIFPQIY